MALFQAVPGLTILAPGARIKNRPGYAGSRWRAIALLGVSVTVAACARPLAIPDANLRCAGCNVVLISIDTLRADHLGCYGYQRDTSPNIDAFATRSILFERASSTAHETAESHMSMFTSLYPSVHRVRNSTGPKGRRLSKGIETLAEVLSDEGFATAGFHGGGNVAGAYGFDRGFGSYTAIRQIGTAVDQATSWVRSHSGDGSPFFLFFHTYKVHDPYTPKSNPFDPEYDGDIIHDEDRLLAAAGSEKFIHVREAFWQRVDPSDPADVEHVKALYDAEIQEADVEIGRLISTIQSLAQNTVVILTADHGEEFLEHGRFQHKQIYQELLHVPLIISLPGVSSGMRIDSRVSLLDLAPTILDILGVSPPSQYQGESLLPVVTQQREPEAIFAEKIFADRPDSGKGRGKHLALIVGDEKLVWASSPELYDLVNDPGEQVDLAGRNRGRLKKLQRIARRIDAQNVALSHRFEQSGGEQVDLPPKTLRRLEALGYI